MNKFEPAIGERYGSRVITAIGERIPYSHIRVSVECDCGSESELPYYALRRTTGCKGCETKCHGFKNVGAKFGNRTVVEHLNSRMVLCKCDCGTVASVAFRDLVSGRATRCRVCGDGERLNKKQKLNEMLRPIIFELLQLGYTRSEIRDMMDIKRDALQVLTNDLGYNAPRGLPAKLAALAASEAK